MKRILIFSFLLVLLIGCNQNSDSNTEELQQEEHQTLIQKYKDEVGENAFVGEANIIETIKPTLVDSKDLLQKGKDTAGPGGDDCEGCCCTCNASITLHPPTVPAGCDYTIEIFAACSSNIDLATAGFSEFIYGWTNIPNPPPTGVPFNPNTTINFEIIDEHFYFLVATIREPDTWEPCTLDATITDAAGGNYKITLTDFLETGTNGINMLMLHCDRISFSECWNGPINNPVDGPRECCLDF